MFPRYCDMKDFVVTLVVTFLTANKKILEYFFLGKISELCVFQQEGLGKCFWGNCISGNILCPKLTSSASGSENDRTTLT